MCTKEHQVRGYSVDFQYAGIPRMLVNRRVYARLVLPKGAILRCILETEHRIAPEGLSRRAFRRCTKPNPRRCGARVMSGGMHSSMERGPRQRDGLPISSPRSVAGQSAFWELQRLQPFRPCGR